MRLLSVAVVLGLLASHVWAEEFGAIDLSGHPGLSPRFYLGASPQLAERGVDGCADDESPCKLPAQLLRLLVARQTYTC